MSQTKPTKTWMDWATYYDPVITPVLITDAHHQIEFCNRAWIQLTGGDDKDQEAEHLLRCVHPLDWNRLKDCFLQDAEQPADHQWRVRLRHHEEGFRWQLLEMTVRLDAESKTFAGYVLSFRDIHDDYLYQESLERQQTIYETIFQTVPARIWFKDAENRIIRLNQAAADSMNLSIEEAEGACSYELFPDMASKYHQDDWEVIYSQTPKLGIIEEYTPANGEKGWLRTDKVPYVDPETGSSYVLVISTDITEEYRARELSEKRSEILANVMEGIAEINLDVHVQTQSEHLHEPWLPE